ncbi:MAG: hypothetical protein ABF586_06915 [Sporolactobacillus sp.]
MLSRSILEVIRIALILLFGAALLLGLLTGVYHLLGLTLNFRGMLVSLIGALVILFILYRNKWQFHGFYNGRSKVRLPHNLSFGLIIFSILCFIIAPLI